MYTDNRRVIKVHVRTAAATTGVLVLGSGHFRCALGRSGIVPAALKREGDGTTPAGLYPLRRLFYRPDRMARPATRLDTQPLTPQTGWCEDPAQPLYNRLVRQPVQGCDAMWRDDHLYDLVIEIGHNDAPVIKGRGSAVFLHLARDNYAPTQGCVALSRTDMLRLLPRLGPDMFLRIG